MKNILFICSWNSCRSQMAEGFGRALSAGDFEIRSAGISSGGVNADAITSMNNIGIDISNHTSDRLSATHYDWADYVVTVCDAAKESCPIVPTGKKAVHWSIRDPYGNYSSEEEKNKNFAEVRDDLKLRIAALFTSIRKGDI